MEAYKYIKVTNQYEVDVAVQELLHQGVTGRVWFEDFKKDFEEYGAAFLYVDHIGVNERWLKKSHNYEEAPKNAMGFSEFIGRIDNGEPYHRILRNPHLSIPSESISIEEPTKTSSRRKMKMRM